MSIMVSVENENKIDSIEIDMKNDCVEENASGSSLTSRTLFVVIKPFVDIGMIPILFMLYAMDFLQNWVSHIKSHDHDILNETKQIQLSTENEIDQVVKDQRRIQEDMDQLQERLHRIEQRRKQRQDVVVQRE